MMFLGHGSNRKIRYDVRSPNRLFANAEIKQYPRFFEMKIKISNKVTQSSEIVKLYFPNMGRAHKTSII